MKIKFKKLTPNAIEPSYANEHAAGLDLSTSVQATVKAFEATLLPTGVAVEIPQGYVGILALRSSTPVKKGLFIPNGVGIIDSDYRGELFVQVAALKEEVTIPAFDRIAQLVIMPARHVAGMHLIGVEEVA
jgi:dUTP pyrophosphatase